MFLLESTISSYYLLVTWGGGGRTKEGYLYDPKNIIPKKPFALIFKANVIARVLLVMKKVELKLKSSRWSAFCI